MTAPERPSGGQTQPVPTLAASLLAPPGEPVNRTVAQAPPRHSSLSSVAADAPPSVLGAGQQVREPERVAPAARKPFQTYEIKDMRMVLADPPAVCARTQMELRGMDRSPKQLQLRVSESLQLALKTYCEDENVQQRALVEALVRAFLAEVGRPVQD